MLLKMKRRPRIYHSDSPKSLSCLAFAPQRSQMTSAPKGVATVS